MSGFTMLCAVIGVLRWVLAVEWSVATYVYYPAVKRIRTGQSDAFDVFAGPFFFLALAMCFSWWSGVAVGPPPLTGWIDGTRRVLSFIFQIIGLAWLIDAKLKIRRMR